MSLKKLLKDNLANLFEPRETYTNKLSYDDLVNAESALGRTLFGPIPAGHQREFFESKKNVWIWHENFLDNLGKMQEMTIRYEVRPTGVYKRVNKSDYHKIEGEELENFRKAAHSYLNLVKTKLYC
ncbi:hypothetical protein IKG33_00595 [Candidatus Saccharibacteria bacterium]|nr:hypothetical protein [Candidatus Saccharibacteria bacterium]